MAVGEQGGLLGPAFLAAALCACGPSSTSPAWPSEGRFPLALLIVERGGKPESSRPFALTEGVPDPEQAPLAVPEDGSLLFVGMTEAELRDVHPSLLAAPLSAVEVVPAPKGCPEGRLDPTKNRLSRSLPDEVSVWRLDPGGERFAEDRVGESSALLAEIGLSFPASSPECPSFDATFRPATAEAWTFPFLAETAIPVGDDRVFANSADLLYLFEVGARAPTPQINLNVLLPPAPDRWAFVDASALMETSPDEGRIVVVTQQLDLVSKRRTGPSSVLELSYDRNGLIVSSLRVGSVVDALLRAVTFTEEGGVLVVGNEGTVVAAERFGGAYALNTLQDAPEIRALATTGDARIPHVLGLQGRLWIGDATQGGAGLRHEQRLPIPTARVNAVAARETPAGFEAWVGTTKGFFFQGVLEGTLVSRSPPLPPELDSICGRKDECGLVRAGTDIARVLATRGTVGSDVYAILEECSVLMRIRGDGCTTMLTAESLPLAYLDDGFFRSLSLAHGRLLVSGGLVSPDPNLMTGEERGFVFEMRIPEQQER